MYYSVRQSSLLGCFVVSALRSILESLFSASSSAIKREVIYNSLWCNITRVLEFSAIPLW
jgi:hypothetical protein